jgi:hypothetical protein
MFVVAPVPVLAFANFGCGFISAGARLALTQRDQCVAALMRENADIKAPNAHVRGLQR